MKSNFFVHPQAIADSTDIGSGTRIWAFSHVMSGTTIGRDCNIGEQCFVESGVRIGDSAVIKNGVALWAGVMVEDRVFIGPNVVFTNDRTPRAKIFRPPMKTVVREGASIGANATILCGLEIGRYSMIAAGSVVTRTVPDFALIKGNPGRVRGYVCKCGNKLMFNCRDHAECSCGIRFSLRGGIVAPITLEVLLSGSANDVCQSLLPDHVRRIRADQQGGL